MVLGAALVASSWLGAVGCSGDEESSTGGGGSTPANGCFDYTSFNATAPAVSFKTDVLPILQLSCALSTSCHGGESGAGGRPYLGTNKDTIATQEQIDKIFAQNVGAPSAKEAGRNIVEAGHPEQSFMMDKLDGDFTCNALGCAENARCGTLMPQGSSEPMEASKRDTIRRWIAQGAKND